MVRPVLAAVAVSYIFRGLMLASVRRRTLVLNHGWGVAGWLLSEDVAGATFMALGSAAPEITINLIAVVRAKTSEDPEVCVRAAFYFCTCQRYPVRLGVASGWALTHRRT